MKIWLDDIRPAPEGYVWCKSVNIAKRTIESAEEPILLMIVIMIWEIMLMMEGMGLNYWIGWWRMNVFIQLGFIR